LPVKEIRVYPGFQDFRVTQVIWGHKVFRDRLVSQVSLVIQVTPVTPGLQAHLERRVIRAKTAQMPSHFRLS
jgi:hypothetical protein